MIKVSDAHVANDNTLHRAFQPANSSEGATFEARWCECCAKSSDDPQADCLIRIQAQCFDACDPAYPSEWKYDADDKPVCTAFQAKRGA